MLETQLDHHSTDKFGTIIATNVLGVAMINYHLLQISHQFFSFKRTLSRNQQTFAAVLIKPIQNTCFLFGDNFITQKIQLPALAYLTGGQRIKVFPLDLFALMGARKFNFRFVDTRYTRLWFQE